MSDGRRPARLAAKPTTEPATNNRDEVPDDYGTLYVVGIEPGLPDHIAKRTRELLSPPGYMVASNLYQELLHDGGTLPPKGNDDGPEIVRSSTGEQIEPTRGVFKRVRNSEDMVHVSGGDPNVYGRSGLAFAMTRGDEAIDVPVEIVPGVTATLSGATMMGAPLSDNSCTISLSDRWRSWGEIEEELRAATISGFIIVLYSYWHNYEHAIDMICEKRADNVPVDIFNDAGRGEAGRNLDDETFSVTTLDDAEAHDDDMGGIGASILIGTHETEPWSNNYQTCLVTPRGGRDVDDF